MSVPCRWGGGFVICQTIISMAMHLREGFIPSGAGFGCRANDQLALLDFKIDGSMQVALLNDGFRNSDALRIPDSYHACFHRAPTLFLMSATM
jgi:hypothetical protein